MRVYVLTEEDKRVAKKAEDNLIFLLEWWKSCYESKNDEAAELVWKMITMTLPINMDFVHHFGSDGKTDLFNALLDLFRGFFYSGKVVPTLEMEKRWMEEIVSAAKGAEYTYQCIWENTNQIHKEVRGLIEEGLLRELAGREDGYEKFYDHFLVYFSGRIVPKRCLKDPRSFFLFVKRDIKFRYGSGDMRPNAKKARLLANKALEIYPPKKKNLTHK